ncbi:MFS transporter [Flammeovirga sp. EKP202]|uniref:MFS transporter n=1 Tax=Flammeovirga sp. EKP202 TaxID=2770592 RepID=UPI00165ED17F|nr:MFS transporter [Flammeovirga sp. EKP202]
MKVKTILMLITLVAVVSDTMLHPFYPQFFGERFGVFSSEHVGYYLAACCLTVMVAFPFWAKVQKNADLFSLLIYTQLIAGLLCVSIYWIDHIVLFWGIALTMIFFKGSYLLIYPYIMQLDEEDEHTSSISILSVIVHLGAIMGAFIGGAIVDYIDTYVVFFIMAMGDFTQLGVCFYLKYRRKVKSIVHEEASTQQGFFHIKKPIFMIGAITMTLYFSTFLIRPFFSVYWEIISEYDSKVISGLMYSLPAFVGLIALWYNHKFKSEKSSFKQILPAVVLGIVGIALQGSMIEGVVIVGRLIYGWAIFQLYVQFDVIAFTLSTPSDYATDYSRIHLMQNFGVLVSSMIAGFTVDLFSIQMTFWMSIVGFLFTGSFFLLGFNSYLKKEEEEPELTTANA